MSLSLTQTKPLPNLRPMLWLLLPLLVLTTLFFWPLSLIVEQALRDVNGNVGLDIFWQVVGSRRFVRSTVGR